MVKIGINGFGRIGRMVFRAAVKNFSKDIQVVAINDLGPVKTNAHLLRHDTVHGAFPGTIVTGADTTSRTRSAIRCASSGLARSSTRIVNSSPP